MSCKLSTYFPGEESSSHIIALCLQIIDDTLYEGMEEFDVEIEDPSLPAKLKGRTITTVIIEGPNDGKCHNISTVHHILC